MTFVAAKIISLLIAFTMFFLFFSPINIIMFYIFFRPLVQPFAYHKYTLISEVPLTSIFSLILIASAYVNALFKKENKLNHSSLIPLYLLLFFSLFSFINTTNYLVSMGGLLKILSGISMYILAYNSIEDEHSIKRILWAFVLCSIIPMATGYYQYFTGTGHEWKGVYYASKRPDSCLGEWNIYGEFLCINIIATLILFLKEKRFNKKKIFLSLIILSLIISLILSMNRGSWISLFLGLMFATLIYKKRIKFKWIVFAGLLITISFGGIIYERFEELRKSKDGYSQNTLQARIDYWNRLIPIVLDKPWIGHGLETAIIEGEMPYKKILAPHNDYIRLGLEIGIPGALFYLVFLLIVFLRSVEQKYHIDKWEINFPVLIIICYFIILSAFQNIIYNVTIFPMFMALLGISHKYETIKQ